LQDPDSPTSARTWSDGAIRHLSSGRPGSGTSQFVTEKPLCGSLSETLHTTILVLPARQIKVTDQLRLIVGQHIIHLVGAMPFVGGAIHCSRRVQFLRCACFSSGNCSKNCSCSA